MKKNRPRPRPRPRPRSLGTARLKTQINLFFGVAAWLREEEDKVLDKADWLTTHKLPIPEILVDRWIELQSRKRTLARERRRFYRRHNLMFQ